MSFTNDIKERISSVEFDCEYCKLAALAALMRFGGRLSETGAYISTESAAVARFGQRLLADALAISCEPVYYENQKLWRISLNEEQSAVCATELAADGDVMQILPFECCRRAFLTGAFLGGGGVSDPKKGYHLELDTKREEYAARAAEVLALFGIHAKIIEHKSRYVVYVKDYESVADVLGLIGADFAALELFSVSVEKQVRNDINRQVNCESANMRKLGFAASQQLAAIKKIQKKVGLGVLSEPLREIAEVRLAYPDDSLKELGGRLTPPIGKSGVNHRLARIIDYAKTL